MAKKLKKIVQKLISRKKGGNARPAAEGAGNSITVRVRVNGRDAAWKAPANEYLLDTLRREGFFSVKKGCETGDCGSCAVLLDGKAAASCLLLAGQAHGRSVTTSEGLGSPHKPHVLQQCFVDTGGTQCGFCIPGMILAAKALLDEHPDPSEEQVREALDGNICRCTGYVKQFEAVLAAAKVSNGKRA
jgi:aerobic-type carbon monoxide dehydrogenase small subunit (CoxS/CutS family)